MENIQDGFETGRKWKYIADPKLRLLINNLYGVEKQLSQLEKNRSQPSAKTWKGSITR